MADRLADLVEDGRVHEALALAKAARSVVTPDLRERLRLLTLAQPVSMLVHVQEDKPWLVTEADVVAAATSAPDEGWGATERLPAYLEPVMSAKAVTTENVALAESLLNRLKTLDTSKHDILGLALERLRSHGPRSLETH